MAKLNTKNAQLIDQLFNPFTGRAISVRTDGRILRKSPFTNGWIQVGTLKSHITPEKYIKKCKSYGYRALKRGDIPSYKEIERMEFDGVASATDGCDNIEPDACCSHGAPAWTQVLLSRPMG